MQVSGPTADEDSAPYWEALREGRIALQRCNACGEVRFPRMPACPNCGSPAWTGVDAGGSGRVYSWIVVQRPLPPFEAADLPCTLATVELAEGCRVLGRLLDGAAGVDVPVRADFVPHSDWTELAFRVVSA
jgi:uncharacterized protein